MYKKSAMGGGGKVSGNHSPMGSLSVEKSSPAISSGIAKERHLGVSLPKATNRPKKRTSA